jgi:hypothetical protein
MSGDLELMRPLWATMMAQLPLLRARTQAWFGHGGVVRRATGAASACGGYLGHWGLLR